MIENGIFSFSTSTGALMQINVMDLNEAKMSLNEKDENALDEVNTAIFDFELKMKDKVSELRGLRQDCWHEGIKEFSKNILGHNIDKFDLTLLDKSSVKALEPLMAINPKVLEIDKQLYIINENVKFMGKVKEYANKLLAKHRGK